MCKKCAIIVVGLLMCGCNNNNFSQRNKKPVFQEQTEWSIFYAWENNSNKERVLVIGDSIAKGYVHKLKSIDGGRAYSLFATSKSVCDPAYINELENVLAHNKYAMITINNGIHGKKYSLERYRESFSRVIHRIKQLTRPAKIAIVLSTPDRKNVSKQIVERNEVCMEIANEKNLAVIDLYNLMKGREELYTDNVHFIDKGKEMQAELIKKTIDSELNK